MANSKSRKIYAGGYETSCKSLTIILCCSRLIQIRKYAEIHNLQDLQELFSAISALAKKVRDELYRLLVEEAGYFG